MARKPAASPAPLTPRWATMDEVAEYLRLTKRTVRDMRRDGRLKGYSLGERVVRFDLNQVDAALGHEVVA